MDQQLATYNQQLDLQRDIEGALKHAAQCLSHDELALLEWATGVQLKESTDGTLR